MTARMRERMRERMRNGGDEVVFILEWVVSSNTRLANRRLEWYYFQFGPHHIISLVTPYDTT
jgi:hypothetical protein